MVSVIIPTYNCGEYIERAITSVINQTYKDYELIIVDDCSTDNTNEILTKFKDLDNFKIIHNEKNVGVGISRKVGINEAKGEYITFLDADDYLLETFLEINVNLIKQHDSDVVYTSVGILSPSNQMAVVNVGNFIAENDMTLNIFFNCEMNFITGKLFRTSILKTCRWSERRVAEDVQTLFYIMYEAKKVRSFPYVGYIHVCREGSLMSYDSKEMNEDENIAYSFHNFCYNCLAEKEMLEFLMDKQDKVFLEPMYKAYFSKVKKTREFIKNKTLDEKIYLENKELWDEVDNFYPKDEE